MPESPQPEGSRPGQFERPNQEWVCGRACLGEPCLPGPDRQGNCRATTECRPIKKGDRWCCTRPGAFGGPCADGPRPEGACSRPIPKCEPVRSLRSIRGAVVWTTVVASCAGLVLLLATRAGREFASPGELSFAHSSSKSNCSDCHAAAGDGAMVFAVTHPHSNDADSRLCLNCHTLGAHPFEPHGQASAALGALRSAHANRSPSTRPVSLALSGVFTGPPAAGASLQCSACHSEHRGKDHDLKKLSNLQCQTCHSIQFASLAGGHPEFAGYPFTRRTRIIFDHSSHLKTHFSNEQFKTHAPNACTGCHEADHRGGMMLARPFEQSCAACHGDQIRGKGRATAPGIAFIRLPGLDLETLRKKNLSVGDWPEFAEGGLTAFSELLLADDPIAKAAIEKLGKTDLLDLSRADEAAIKAAHQLGWAVKELCHDLAVKGQAELARRIRTNLGTRLDPDEVTRMTGLFSPDVLDGAIKQWFPNLAAEVSAHRSGAKLPASAVKTQAVPPAKGVKPEAWVESGGWYRSDSDYSILYRPGRHADEFLRSWLTLAADDARHRTNGAARRVFAELASPKSPGVCTKCHSVDANSAPVIHWHGSRPIAEAHPFTKFSHAAHFSLLDDRGCMTCHAANEAEKGYLEAFEKNPGRDSRIFRSNFKPIQKDQCASCHTPRFAGDSCLLCHNYHTGTFAPTVSASGKRMNTLPGGHSDSR